MEEKERKKVEGKRKSRELNDSETSGRRNEFKKLLDLFFCSEFILREEISSEEIGWFDLTFSP